MDSKNNYIIFLILLLSIKSYKRLIYYAKLLQNVLLKLDYYLKICNYYLKEQAQKYYLQLRL